MIYSKVGRSGLEMSKLSFGSWVTFHKQLDVKNVVECMSMAFDHGINFFDNAEVYSFGKAEELMGEAFRKLGWNRVQYIVSTKFYWGIGDGPNQKNTLNRKYLRQAIEGSLKRLGLDYVDIAYCHRADPLTPIEETVWAMHDMIQRGQALYWGTSEWSASEIMQAWQIADKHNLHKPIVEQPQYNLFHRERVEKEYARLYSDIGLGLTIWSPLASGVLTGKYLKGIPENSRAAMSNLEFVREAAQDMKKKLSIEKFVNIAREMDFSPGQLAIAWCAANPNVSSVILGASGTDQLKENLGALNLLENWNHELQARVEACF